MARPAQFDHQQALEQSMYVFWENGYTHTSLQQLGERMNLRPGSLYGAFKSKRALFLQSLDLYFERSSALLAERLSRGDRAIEGIHYFFDALVQDLITDDAHKGCLMINSATELANQDEEIRQKLAHMFANHEQQFSNRLMLAQAEGDVDIHRNANAMAQFLLMGVRGMKVYAQTERSPQVIRALAQQLIRFVAV